MATFLETSSNIWLGGLGLAFLISIKILQKVYYLSTSPLSVLPGPKRENWLLGNLPEVWADVSLLSFIQARELIGIDYFVDRRQLA